MRPTNCYQIIFEKKGRNIDFDLRTQENIVLKTASTELLSFNIFLDPPGQFSESNFLVIAVP